MIKIGAHSLGIDAEKLTYAGGNVLAPDGRKHTWQDAVELAHRQFHNLPEGMDPGLAAFDIMQVPTGNALPVDGKVHMYPCYSFEFHQLAATIPDGALARDITHSLDTFNAH